MATLERKRLENDGYVVLEGLLDPQEDIAPLVDEYDVRLSTCLLYTSPSPRD